MAACGYTVLTALAADPWPRRACDMPDADLARTTVDSAEACEATCSARADCGGYTFVSGLNRCALEKPGAKAFELQMFAARIQVEDGRRSTTEPEPDHDHAGKDLETAPARPALTRRVRHGVRRHRVVRGVRVHPGVPVVLVEGDRWRPHAQAVRLCGPPCTAGQRARALNGEVGLDPHHALQTFRLT
jgi:hypothetical protein